MEDIKSEMSNGSWCPRHLSMFSNLYCCCSLHCIPRHATYVLLLFAALYTKTCYICIVVVRCTVYQDMLHMYCCCSLHCIPRHATYVLLLFAALYTKTCMYCCYC